MSMLLCVAHDSSGEMESHQSDIREGEGPRCEVIVFTAAVPGWRQGDGGDRETAAMHAEAMETACEKISFRKRNLPPKERVSDIHSYMLLHNFFGL